VSEHLPNVLDLGIGDSSGYRVFYDGSRLVWQRTSAVGDVLDEEVLDVSEGDWREFWRALEAAGVWSWEAYYEPEYPTCGGSQWGAWIEHEGRVLRTSGRDAWPAGFERYLEAVEKLIGGRPFS
jgi:hypothetical protein